MHHHTTESTTYLVFSDPTRSRVSSLLLPHGPVLEGEGGAARLPPRHRHHQRRRPAPSRHRLHLPVHDPLRGERGRAHRHRGAHHLAQHPAAGRYQTGLQVGLQVEVVSPEWVSDCRDYLANFLYQTKATITTDCAQRTTGTCILHIIE